MTRTKIVALAAAGLLTALSSGAALSNSTAYTEGPKNIFEGVFSADQAKRGQSLYSDNCGVCHGPTAGGGSAAPGIVGSALDMKAGMSLSDLVDYMIMAMPPEAPGKLRTAEYVDITAYLLQLHGAEAGETELPRKIKDLADFEIVEKPAE